MLITPTKRLRPTTGRDGARSARRRLDPFTIVTAILIAISIAGVLYAVIRFLSVLIYQNGKLDFSAFAQFVSTPEVVGSIGSTAIIVGVSAVFAVAIGGIIAWLNERTDAHMGPISDVLPFLPFLSPPIAGAIGWVFLLAPTSGFINAAVTNVLSVVGIHLTTSPFNIYSYPGVIFVYVIYEVPFAFLMISAGLRNMDSELEEQSRMSGASPIRTLVRVVAPALAPSIAGAFLLVVWSGFGMYAIPEAIASPAQINVMSVEIVRLLTFDFPPQYGAAIVLSLVMVAFVAIAWYLQSRVLRGSRHATSGGRGRKGPRRSLGKAKWPLRVFVLAYFVIATVLPAAALLMVAINGYWTPNINWGHLSFTVFTTIFNDPVVLSALRDSFSIGALVATVGMIVAAMVSVLMVSSRSRIARIADGALKLPVIVSHIVLAVGFILAFAGPPFQLGGTWAILFLAYFLLFMAQGTLATDPVAAQVGTQLREASQISGAHPWRTFRKIYFPLLLPGIAVGWALLFVRILGDLEVSALLAGPSNPTIGQQTLVLSSQGNYAQLAALTIVLFLVTTIVVVGVLALARRHSRWSIAAPLR
ncbi:MAG TPA: iron ABC transporter permease [Pseudolysinimonas sp.]|jgi:iron(III) transport system permease protein